MYLYFCLIIMCSILDINEMVFPLSVGIIWELSKWFWKNIQRLVKEEGKQCVKDWVESEVKDDADEKNI